MDQHQERLWWEAVRANDDKRLFDRLYLACWEKLYHIAWNRTKDENISKDIVQEVFVSLWERRKQIAIKTSIVQYLTGALKHRIIDHFQSEQVKRKVFESAYLQMEKAIVSPDTLITYQQVEAILEEELSKMPENMRNSFLLRQDNLSVKEIARKLNLAEQTVNNLLTQASKQLRKNLPNRFQYIGSLLLIALFGS